MIVIKRRILIASYLCFTVYQGDPQTRVWLVVTPFPTQHFGLSHVFRTGWSCKPSSPMIDSRHTSMHLLSVYPISCVQSLAYKFREHGWTWVRNFPDEDPFPTFWATPKSTNARRFWSFEEENGPSTWFSIHIACIDLDVVPESFCYRNMFHNPLSRSTYQEGCLIDWVGR